MAHPPVSRSWKLTVHAVDGPIRARGKFPCDPVALKNAEIIYRDGAWWMSICAEMPARLVAGAGTTMVRLDLIDEFARVERAEGPMSGPAERPKRLSFHRDEEGSDGASPETGGDDRRTSHTTTARIAAASPEAVAAAQHLAKLLAACRHDQDVADALAAERDRRFRRGSCAFRAASRRITGRLARAKRRRREALHVWTTAIIRLSGDLTVVTPPVRTLTASAAGTVRDPGGAVATVARVNRHVLAQAPAAAVAMLTYKAAETAVRCDVVTTAAHDAFVGHDISHLAKLERTARRNLRKARQS